MNSENFGITAKNYSKAYRALIGFVGDPTKFHVHHMDGNKENNHHSNLVLISSRLHIDFHKAKKDYSFLLFKECKPLESVSEKLKINYATPFVNNEITLHELFNGVSNAMHEINYVRENNYTIELYERLLAEIEALKVFQLKIYSPRNTQQ